MWKCFDCGWDSEDDSGHEEPDERLITQHHPYGEGTAAETLVDAFICPCCGSENVDEIDSPPEEECTDDSDE